ncbi:MAG TPA: hypothetical protein VGC66_01625 [Pyrinomonadaceae bacterium]|jgi:hypothetical protein
MELKEKIKNFRGGINNPAMTGQLKAQFMASAETILREEGQPPLASVLGLSPANIGVIVDLQATDAELGALLESDVETKMTFTFSGKLLLRILSEEVELEFHDLILLAKVGGVKSRRFWHPKSELQSVVGELSQFNEPSDRYNVVVNAVHDGRLRKGDFAVQLLVEMSNPTRSG